jgi:hypothetical protein
MPVCNKGHDLIPLSRTNGDVIFWHCPICKETGVLEEKIDAECEAG